MVRMQPLSKRTMTSSLWIVLLWTSWAAAEATAPPEPPPEPKVRVYATATVSERPLDSATAEVTVIDRETIDSLDARTVGELLRFVPGLDVTGNATRGGLATARIRGGDPNFTLVLIDGVAVNDGTYQVGEVFNLEALPAAAVERIEIVRGPLSARYGSSGLAGVIHVITRRAETPRRLTVDLQAGDADLRSLHTTFAAKTPRSEAFLALSADGEERRIAGESFDLVQLQGRARVDVGESAYVELAGRVAAWEGDDYPEASGGPLFGSGELRRADNAELSLGVEAGVGRQRLRAAVYRHRMDRESPAIFPLVPASEEETTFTRLRLGWSWSLQPRDDHDLGVGVDVEREEGSNDSVLLLPPFLGGAVPGDYQVERTTPGAYAEWVTRRGRLSFELAARVDAPEDVAAPQLSPRLGLSYRVSERARLRFSAGRAFKLPSFFALASPPALGGNPDLRPEVMRGADAGFELAFPRHRLETGIAIFYNRYRDLVDFDFDTFAHVNRSRVEAKGVEGRLAWRPNERFGLAVNLTRQDVADLDGGGPLRERPDWVGGIRIDVRPARRLTIHLDGQGVSERFDSQIPLPRLDRVAGYRIWGAGASWRLTRAFWLRARLDNLTDERYQTQIGFPGPGRSLRLGLRYAPVAGDQEP